MLHASSSKFFDGAVCSRYLSFKVFEVVGILCGASVIDSNFRCKLGTVYFDFVSLWRRHVIDKYIANIPVGDVSIRVCHCRVDKARFGMSQFAPSVLAPSSLSILLDALDEA